MDGKKKCKILKQIRKSIADQNGIAYVTEECKFKGACKGTCPKCEAEVRYLEQELEKQRQLGKRIAVAGVATAMVATMAGCSVLETVERKLKGTATTGMVGPAPNVNVEEAQTNGD